MNYKVGDKVRIVSKWVSGCHENPEGKMDKYLGKVMTIKCVGGSIEHPVYQMFEDQQDQDRIGYGWTWHAPSIAGLACMESIHITADGDKVISVLKNGKKIVKRAEAKCSPRDTFDFAIGANLAYKRLMDEPADPTAGEEKASALTKPMTCREKLAIEHPEKVGDFYAGCFGCPHQYGYAKRECDYKCRECWDRPVEQPEETKQPENALKIEIGKKYKLKEYDAVGDHHGISRYTWNIIAQGAIIPMEKTKDGNWQCKTTTLPFFIAEDAFECEWVDKQETQPQFKVGDRVMITNGWADAGKFGTIIADDGSTHAPYRVELDNGVLHWKYGYNLEKVEQQKEPEYKVGDLVQVVGTGNIYSRYDRWVKMNAPEYLSKFFCDHLPDSGETGVIRVIAPHCEDCKRYICLIECARNRVFVIGFDGISKF